jgi:hypothetical protein
MGKTKYIPANSRAADLNCYLTRLQALAAFYLLERGLRFCNPQVMLDVCEDANVGLIEDSCRSHDMQEKMRSFNGKKRSERK